MTQDMWALETQLTIDVTCWPRRSLSECLLWWLFSCLWLGPDLLSSWPPPRLTSKPPLWWPAIISEILCYHFDVSTMRVSPASSPAPVSSVPASATAASSAVFITSRGAAPILITSAIWWRSRIFRVSAATIVISLHFTLDSSEMPSVKTLPP